MPKQEPITLTDSEWMSVISAERDGLPRCCANVSALRDVIISLAREDGQWYPFKDWEFKLVFAWVLSSHGKDDFPDSPIWKIVEQLDINVDELIEQIQKEQEHLPSKRERASGNEDDQS